MGKPMGASSESHEEIPDFLVNPRFTLSRILGYWDPGMPARQGALNNRVSGFAVFEFIDDVVAGFPGRYFRRNLAPVVGGFFHDNVFAPMAVSGVPCASLIGHGRYPEISNGFLEMGIW